MISLTQEPDGVRLTIKVVPGASRDRIVGALGDALKVAVSKPPADGAANRAVIKLLAGELGVSPSQIAILRGHGSPRKEISIAGVTVADLTNRLERFS